MEFVIATTWDGKPVHHEPASITLKPLNGEYAELTVSAPFFNDPPAPPGGHPGEPYFKLWEYEVVEAFFLAPDEKYLEVELSPHGQHLLLLLNGRGNAVKHSLSLPQYRPVIEGDRWKGTALVPAEYFPPAVNRFNAYAIHGSDDNRVYEALFPTPWGKYDVPNFHRLEYFWPIDFAKIVPSNPTADLSEIWQDALTAQLPK